MPTPAPTLTSEQLEAFGQELDAIRARVVADLGERDADLVIVMTACTGRTTGQQSDPCAIFKPGGDQARRACLTDQIGP